VGRTDDLLILGGGPIGAATAWHAAQAGLGVRVLDAPRPGAPSAARSVGLVDVLGTHAPAYLRARGAAVAETTAWIAATATAAAVGWNPSGSLNPTAAAGDVAVLRAAGVAAQWWDAERLAREEPALRLDGALFVPGDACLDPAAYLGVLRAKAVASGAEWVRESAGPPVAAGGHWTVGRWQARRVLVAAGAWSPLLLPGLPVRPVRGTVLETPPLPPLLRRYTPALRQLPDGRIWIGGSAEEAGFDLEPNPAIVAELRRGAADQLPALGAVVPQRIWTGLRPMPADGLPLAGAWPGAPGLLVCVTHSGVTMAQWLGRRMAALAAGAPVDDLRPFAPGRPAPGG